MVLSPTPYESSSSSTRRVGALHRSGAPWMLASLVFALGALVGCSSGDEPQRYRVLASPLSETQLQVPGGPTVTIPAGALGEETWIVATQVPSVRPPRNTAAVATPLRLGPEGQTFQKPVEVTMPIEPSQLPAGSSLDDVVMMRAPQGSDVFVPLPTRRSGTAAVAAVTEHFSDFVAVVFVGNPPECGNRVCDSTEACGSCPGDCGLCFTNGPACGDLACGIGETCGNCAYDCGACSGDPVEAWKQQVVKLVTDRFVECRAGEAARARFALEAASFFRGDLAPERLAAGTVAFDAARAQQCIDALEAWPACSLDVDVVLGMCIRQVAHGVQGQGAECAASFDCDEGLVCSFPVDSSPCSGVCMPGAKAAPGEPCHDVSDCAPPTTRGHMVTCDLGGGGFRVCGDVAPRAALGVGAACKRVTDDSTGPLVTGCGPGLVCWSASGPLTDLQPDGVCATYLPDGEVCVPSSGSNGGATLCREEISDCIAVDASGQSGHLCYPSTLDVGLGGSCDPDAGMVFGRGTRQCDRSLNLRCGTSGLCEPAGTGVLGSDCASDSDCQGGAPCVYGTCARFLANDADCDPDYKYSGDLCLLGPCHGELQRCVLDPFVVNPGGPEACDGYDNDCNGQIDEGFPTMPYYVDSDYDGYYGDGAPMQNACMLLSGLSSIPGDCAPDDWSINPAVAEVPYNGIDDDCDGGTADSLCGDATCDSQGPYFEDSTSCPADCP